MKRLTLLLLSLLFISCNKNDLKVGPLETTLISKGELYGNGQENITKQNLAISNSADWNELMEKMNSVNNVTQNFTETSLDFSRYLILAVFDEIKMNGGHSIDITNVTESKNDITVKIENLLSGNLTTVITQPFHIVKIPRIEKTIIFKNKE